MRARIITKFLTVKTSNKKRTTHVLLVRTMKAELVYGKIVRIEDNTLVLENTEGEEFEYDLDIELDENWVGANLGNYMTVVIVDGSVKGFRD